jgi:hypothetical protein
MTVQTLSNTWFLFTNQTTDANSDPVSVNYANKTAIIKVWGTFGGANVKFQTLAPQSSPNVWIDVPDMNGAPITFTSNKQSVIEFLVQNEQVRAVLSSSSGTTTINASLEIY